MMCEGLTCFVVVTNFTSIWIIFIVIGYTYNNVGNNSLNEMLSNINGKITAHGMISSHMIAIHKKIIVLLN